MQKSRKPDGLIIIPKRKATAATRAVAKITVSCCCERSRVSYIQWQPATHRRARYTPGMRHVKRQVSPKHYRGPQRRPDLGPSTAIVNCKVTPEEREALKRYAEQCNLTVSEYLRKVAIESIPAPVSQAAADRAAIAVQSSVNLADQEKDGARVSRSSKSRESPRCWHGWFAHQCPTCNNI